MREWIERTLTVQDKDLRIIKLRGVIASAPEDTERIEQIRMEASAEVTSAKERLQENEKALKSLEMEAGAIEEKMRQFQSKSAMIKNNEEYAAALEQIRKCEEQISATEDRELELMLEIEEATEDLDGRRRDFDAAKQRVEEMLADIDTRLQNATAQVEKLEVERQQAMAEIDPEIVRKYERIRKSISPDHPEQRVMVAIRNGVCDRCRMNVTAQIRMDARKGNVILCQNCGAMLHWEG